MKIDYLEELNFLEIANIEELKTSRGTVEFFKKSDDDYGKSSIITTPDLRYYWDGKTFGLHISDFEYNESDWTSFLNRNTNLLTKFKILYLGRITFKRFSPLQSDLSKLEFLHLSENNKLNTLNCEYLPNLQQLLVSNCPELDDIYFKGEYRKLKYLDLSNCNFEEINFANAKFPLLKSMNLGGNPFRKELPFVLHNFPNIHHIYGVSELTDINRVFFDGKDLNARKLFAQHLIDELEDEINQFKDVNRTIRLTDKNFKLNDQDRIYFLDIGHLYLKRIPLKVLEIKTLEHLCLGSLFPDKFENYNNIKWLGSSFHEISPNDKNLFTSFELEKLSNLPNLKSLYLSHIDLDSLDFIKRIPKLISLDISYNSRIDDYKPLIELKYLELLYASGLKSFSNKETKFLPSSLRFISLESCSISRLNFISNIKKAEYIYLNKNIVTTESLFKFIFDSNDNLKIELLAFIKSSNDGEPGTFLSNNLIDEALFSVLDEKDLERKRHSLEAYLANIINEPKRHSSEAFLGNEIKEDEIQFRQVKLILIGNTKAGKTTLFDIFCKDTPNYEKKSTGNSTHGLNIETVEFLDKNKKLNLLLKIYDFGGQDYYHSTHWPYFTTENTQYILVFRNDSEDKFAFIETDGIKEMTFPMNYWLDSVNNAKNVRTIIASSDGKNTNLYLMQNTYKEIPVDLNLKNIKEKYNKNLNIEVIPPTMLKGVLENHGGNTYETFKNNLVLTIKQKSRNYTVIPKSRFDFIKELKKNSKGLIRKSEIEFSGKNQDWIDLSIELAHNTYDFINRKEEELKDYVITDISKFNEYIFTILQKKEDCYFSYSDAKNRLNNANLGDEEIQYILDFMKVNKIIFNIKNEKYFLAPAFLDDKLNEAEEILVKTFNKPLIQYEFHSYFHSNIFTEIVIKFSEDKNLLKDGWKYVLKKGYVFLFDSSSDKKNLLHIKFELNEIPIIEVYNHSIFGVDEDFVEKIHVTLDKIVNYDKTNPDKIKKLVFNKYGDSVDYKLLETEGVISQEGRKTDLIFSKNRLFRKGDFRVFLEKEERKKLKMKKIFISYSKYDEAYKEEFIDHLAALKSQDLVETFDDRNIEMGDKFDRVIKQKIAECDLFICLISRHFLNVKYIFEEEFPEALANNKTIIPLIIRPCDWQNMAVGTKGEKLGDWNAHDKGKDMTTKPEFRNGKGQLIIEEFTDNERDKSWLNFINKLREHILNN